MKHLITAILLALAVAAGLLLPQVFMEWQDRKLETPQLVSVTEPTLEWNPSKGQAAREVTGEDIAHRLKLFEAGPQVTVPIGTATADDAQRATDRAMAFLNMVLEVEPQVFNFGSEYQLAWFEDGTTIPFWTTYVNFHGDCAFIVNVDGETGAILQCLINPNAIDLAELFPESFVRASNEPDTSFEELVAQRFCDALGFFMGNNDGSENPVSLSEEPDSVYINFSDGSTASIMVRLYVDIMDGIWFNHP